MRDYTINYSFMSVISTSRDSDDSHICNCWHRHISSHLIFRYVSAPSAYKAHVIHYLSSCFFTFDETFLYKKNCIFLEDILPYNASVFCRTSRITLNLKVSTSTVFGIIDGKKLVLRCDD